jgi:hypothetical protein
MNTHQVPTTVTEDNKACVICRAKNTEDAADCAATLALCSDQKIFTTLCSGLCQPHRMHVVQALAQVAKNQSTLPPLSLDVLPKGDPRALALRLREYPFLEILELFLRILQINALLTNTLLGQDAVIAMRRHILARRFQEKNNPQWEKAWADHLASEVRNTRALLYNLGSVSPEREAQVKQLWSATWSPE